MFDYEAFHGGSNIYISARDLHRWNASFFRKPLPARNPPFALTLGSWYRADDDSAHWYSGHLQGFHSEVFRDLRAKTSIVYVSNNTLAPWLQKGIVRAVRSILAGRDPGRLQPPAVSRTRQTGTWDGLRIEQTGETLSLVLDGIAYRMVEVEPGFFYVPGVDPMIGFMDGGDLYVSSNLAERRLQRGGVDLQ